MKICGFVQTHNGLEHYEKIRYNNDHAEIIRIQY